MVYFDTDVWINSLVFQDETKHEEACLLVDTHRMGGSLLTSWLCIQEMAFVLGKLNQSPQIINRKLSQLSESFPVVYGYDETIRANELAYQIGYKHFNDCLHVAIAEQHCTDLYTYNHADFIRLQRLTALNIHIL